MLLLNLIDLAHYSFFSLSNNIIFCWIPPGPLYPPIPPLDLITLWQGISIGFGFFAHAFATALDELGLPIAIAISL